MPRFNPNPTEAQGGIVNFPKGSYTFEVKGVKPFDSSKPEKESHGVMITVEVVNECPQKGKKAYPRLWLSSEGARNAAKSFQLSVFGFTPKQEEEWNSQYGGKDWGYDTDEKVCGAGWMEMVGQLISADLDIQMLGDAEFQQYRWRPYNPE